MSSPNPNTNLSPNPKNYCNVGLLTVGLSICRNLDTPEHSNVGLLIVGLSLCRNVETLDYRMPPAEVRYTIDIYSFGKVRNMQPDHHTGRGKNGLTAGSRARGYKRLHTLPSDQRLG